MVLSKSQRVYLPQATLVPELKFEVRRVERQGAGGVKPWNRFDLALKDQKAPELRFKVSSTWGPGDKSLICRVFVFLPYPVVHPKC